VIIGVMRQRVTIQSPQEVRSPSGETTLQWVDVATVFAQVEGLSSRDIMQAQQANVLATHKIRIRYRDGVTHLHRIKWRNRIMELASVTERDKRTYLEMMAREVQ
jgi:SPP1 family predicted phage head-tail adaptor